MTFEQFYRVLLKRWAIVVICFVFVGLGAYLGTSKLLKPRYTSSALVEVIVRTGTSPFNSDNIQASQLLAQTESNLATTNTVLNAVASRHSGLAVEDLAKNVTAAVKSNTQLFEITVQDENPALAATLANEISTTLIQQQLQVTQQPAADGSFLVVAEKAHPALLPSSPNKLINTGAGLLVGLLLGILLAVLFEVLDTRIRTKEGLASLLKWPVLGTIWRTSSKATVISATGYSVNADAYGILRSDMEFASIDKPLQTLVVTSATPEDGKSVVAANLAISMARSGKSTLLIDANLRHPTLYELFDIPSHAMGFSNAILAFRMSMSANQQSRAGNDSERDERSLSPFIRTVNIPNLSVMPSGPLPPSPSELLGSKAMQRFFIMLAQSGIEAVIFDTPSLLGLSDAVVLASKVDGTLVVVDITRAKRGELRQAKELLEQAGANVLGCVVNKQREDHKNTPYKRNANSYDSEPERRSNKDESYDNNKNRSAPFSSTPVTSLPTFQERAPAANPVTPLPAYSERPLPVNPVTPIPAQSSTPVLAASVTSVPTTPILPRPVTSSTPRPVTSSPQRPGEVAPSRPTGSSSQEAANSRPANSSPQRPIEAAPSRPTGSPQEAGTSRPANSSSQRPGEAAPSRPAGSSTQRPATSVPARPAGSSAQRQSSSEPANSETVPSKQRESSSHSNQEIQDEKEKQQSSDVGAENSSKEATRNVEGEQTMLISQVHQRGSGE